MALSERKIPIIAGRNDIPTTSGTNPKHPNGSLITKQFNDLIDNELTAIQISLNNLNDFINNSQFKFNGSDNNYSNLIRYILSHSKLTIFYDLQGNQLSYSNSYENFWDFNVKGFFTVSSTIYLPNQWHSFPFGEIKISTNSSSIDFVLNTTNVTQDTIIPFFISMEDTNNNIYTRVVELIIGNFVLPDFNGNSGGSGS